MITEKPVGTLYTNKEINIIKKIIKSQKPLTYGKEILKFEKKFSRHLGAKYSVAVSSCGAALNISTKLLNIKKGDKVLCQSNAFWVTIVSLLERGADIRVVDVNPETLNVDINDLKKKINKKTKAIYLVHHGGNPAELDKVNYLSKKFKVPIVEDCAHALGAKINKKKIGSNSLIACFSFAQHKNISTLGEGGMLVTNNKEFYENAMGLRSNWPIGKRKKRQVKALGINNKPESPAFMHAGDAWDYDWTKVKEFGSTYRMSTLQAAVGIEQLKKLKKLNLIRQKIAKKYTESISKLEIFKPIKILKNYKHAWYLYDMLLDEKKCKISRDQIIQILIKKFKIKLKNRYWPIHLGAIMRMKGNKAGDCPSFEKVWFKNLLSLPIAPSMTSSEINKILNSLKFINDKYKSN
mgnify:CR=1 FL=1